MSATLESKVDFIGLLQSLKRFNIIDRSFSSEDNKEIFSQVKRKVETHCDVIRLLLVCLRKPHADVVKEFDSKVYEKIRGSGKARLLFYIIGTYLYFVVKLVSFNISVVQLQYFNRFFCFDNFFCAFYS